jgi:hypothetical protein
LPPKKSKSKSESKNQNQKIRIKKSESKNQIQKIRIKKSESKNQNQKWYPQLCHLRMYKRSFFSESADAFVISSNIRNFSFPELENFEFRRLKFALDI